MCYGTAAGRPTAFRERETGVLHSCCWGASGGGARTACTCSVWRVKLVCVRFVGGEGTHPRYRQKHWYEYPSGLGGGDDATDPSHLDRRHRRRETLHLTAYSPAPDSSLDQHDPRDVSRKCLPLQKAPPCRL